MKQSEELLFVVCVFFAAASVRTVRGLPEPSAGLGDEVLSRAKRAGACETSADCVAPNVCSKWGWCQWTKIYGEEGPSQGASAPAGGRAGQCKTSADCASRVPYCSKLGFCHGGRLPFDEAQLEIVGDEEAQGFINNNPRKNSPIHKKSGSSNNGGAAPRRNGGNGRKNAGNG